MQNTCRSCGCTHEVDETSEVASCPSCGAVTTLESHADPGVGVSGPDATPAGPSGEAEPAAGPARAADSGAARDGVAAAAAEDGMVNAAGAGEAAQAGVAGDTASPDRPADEDDDDEDEDEPAEAEPDNARLDAIYHPQEHPEGVPAAAHQPPHLLWLGIVLPVLAALVLVLVRLNPSWWQGIGQQEVKRYELNVIYATPSILEKPDPLASERDPARRRALAARLFVEFYWFNVRERVEWCADEGVDIQKFALAFSRAHQRELRQARELLDPGLTDDMVYSRVQARMHRAIGADMERLEKALHRSSRSTCRYLNDHADDVVWRMHIAGASSTIHSILQENLP